MNAAFGACLSVMWHRYPHNVHPFLIWSAIRVLYPLDMRGCWSLRIYERDPGLLKRAWIACRNAYLATRQKSS